MLLLLSLLFIILLGLSLGSFGSMLLYRIPRGETLGGRSHCTHCQTSLHWYDLVPLMSFLALRGRCRACKKRISWKYPLIEITTALLFLFLALALPPMSIFALLFLAVATYMLILIAFEDFETQKIPDLFITIAFLSALLFRVFHAPTGGETEMRDAFLGASLPLLFFGALCIMSHEEWIGSGDILLGTMIGLLLGVKLTLLALFFAYVGGALIASLLILLHIVKAKGALAFAPFLSGGALLALFFGERFLLWYTNVAF
jgi:leader peptidase (prepilin peptidase)/N-methyltransferase